MTDIPLAGFDVSVLAGYLGALGLFRAVARQRDPEATLRFSETGIPILGTLEFSDAEQLSKWITGAWKPSPLASPWNRGAGFHGANKKIPCSDGTKRCGVELIRATVDPRLALYRSVLDQEIYLLESTGYPDAIDKGQFIRLLRGVLPDEVLPWLDALVVIEGKQRPAYPALLVSGGNDGRLDLAANFMLRLCQLLAFDGNLASTLKPSRSADLLQGAVFGAWVAGLEKESSGQFDGATREAPNGSSGQKAFQAGRLSNPWTFLWLMEGTLWFGGAATRRLGSHGRNHAAIPFQARRVGAGYASATAAEEGKDELWAPLWPAPATLHEIQALFGEARTQVGRRRAASGLDYARAVAAMGTVRGIDRFTRFTILKRAGDSMIAVRAGEFRAGASERVDRLREIDNWIMDFERLAALKTAPPRFAAALHCFQERVFHLARRGDAHALAEVLAALGRMERELARQPHLVWGKSPSLHHVRPLHIRNLNWLLQADDGSPELEIALALAGLDGRRPHATLRNYLEGPEEETPPRVMIAHSLSAVPLMTAMLDRRLMEQHDASADHSKGALATGGKPGAGLRAVGFLISGALNVERLLDLTWALSCLHGDLARPLRQPGGQEEFPWGLPRLFALLRCTLPPRPLAWHGEVFAIRPEPALLRLLLAGRPDQAAEKAARRLRASGLTPLSISPLPKLSPAEARRLAAALLVPITHAAQETLVRAVLFPKTPVGLFQEETADHQQESSP